MSARRHRGRARRFRRRLHHRRQLRQTEIQNLGLPSLHQKNVRRLDVAMDDAFGVRRVQPIGNLNPDLQKLRYLHRLPADAVLQRAALQKFHRDERTAFKFADVVNRADPRMVQRGCRARFAAETFDGLGVLRNIVGQKLQRHIAAQPRILGLVHHAHSAAAELFDDAVMGNRAADNGGCLGHGPASVPHRGTRCQFAPRWPTHRTRACGRLEGHGKRSRAALTELRRMR